MARPAETTKTVEFKKAAAVATTNPVVPEGAFFIGALVVVAATAAAVAAAAASIAISFSLKRTKKKKRNK